MSSKPTVKKTTGKMLTQRTVSLSQIRVCPKDGMLNTFPHVAHVPQNASLRLHLRRDLLLLCRAWPASRRPTRRSSAVDAA
jgi:hypothetical protein